MGSWSKKKKFNNEVQATIIDYYKNVDSYNLQQKIILMVNDLSLNKNMYETINFKSKGFGLTSLCLIYDAFLIKNPELISNYISFLVEKKLSLNILLFSKILFNELPTSPLLPKTNNFIIFSSKLHL